MPELRAVLGIDVIASASNPNHLLSAIPHTVRRLLTAACARGGVDLDGVLDRQHVGDGELLAFPARTLPDLVDMAAALEILVAEHNLWHKPEVRLRIAIHLGPLPDGLGYYRTNIDRSRLLDGPTFKQVITGCLRARPDTFATALILSSQAFDTVFSGDYTSVVRRHEFGEITVLGKEHHATAWVRVSGVDAATVSGYASDVESANHGVTPQASPPTTEPLTAPAGRGFSNHGDVQGHQVSGDHNSFGDAVHNVSNHAGGDNTGVQAGIVHGGIRIAGGGR
jgi:hypothetical protein